MLHDRGPTRWLHAIVLVAGCTANPGAQLGEDSGVELLPARELANTDAQQPRAPVELTASDGTGLRLVSLDAHAVVEGPIAFTELRLTFENPQDRRIEGRFAIELPARASISRLAMKISGIWQEGEVVERQAARVAYEDALHRKQDPALLEHDAGGRFTARVFPIEARERKELIVAWSQELPRVDEPYRLPLRGLSQLERLDAEVTIHHADGAPEQIAVHEREVTPSADLELPIGAAATSLRHDNLALARVTVGGDEQPVAMTELVVLFDTSASGALGFDARIVRLRELIAALQVELGDAVKLRVLAFDQGVREIHRGTLGNADDDLYATLATRRALGASDLAKALHAAGEGAHPGARVLIVSDGVATAGATELVDLERAATRLRAAGIARIDALAEGSSRAGGSLASITTAPGLDAGVVIDARATNDVVVHRLRTRAYEDLAVAVSGSTWVWPETLSGVQPGDEVLIFADLPHDTALRVELGDGGEAFEPVAAQAPGPLLERAWFRAYIERLQDKRSRLLLTDQRGRAALRQIIVGLSTQKRVVSDFTALLVLEGEADYRRFGIDRNALGEIMVVGAHGIETTSHRASPPSSPLGRAFALGNDDEDVWGSLTGVELGESADFGGFADPDDRDPSWDGDELGEAYGVGGLGLVGTGRGGGGTHDGVGLIGQGWGSGYGRGGAASPQVRIGAPVIEGGLESAAVNRGVRIRAHELRWCYLHALDRDPNAHGSIALGLVITPGGRTSYAGILASTVDDEEIGACIVRLAEAWRFVKPSDGEPAIVFTRLGFGTSSSARSVPDAAQRARLRTAAAGARAHDVAIEGAALRHSLLHTTKQVRLDDRRARELAEAARTAGSPWDGKLFDTMALLERGDTQAALELALSWRESDPGDVLALVALGEVAEAAADLGTAARAYGSIIDLFPGRADLRRYAGARLERLGGDALALAVDDYRAALASRPDHPSSHRGLAIALARTGLPREATLLLRDALHEPRILWGRFNQADRILREDLTIVAAAWLAADPSAAAEIHAILNTEGLTVAAGASLRFVLTWETDANDVDFHIHDGAEGHAFYSERSLPSGGELYADITSGYGPECFAISGTPSAFPFRLRAHYYARGPMGYGMGRVQVMQHDGNGGLRFEERPFIAMKDKAWVELGTIDGPLR